MTKNAPGSMIKVFKSRSQHQRRTNHTTNTPADIIIAAEDLGLRFTHARPDADKIGTTVTDREPREIPNACPRYDKAGALRDHTTRRLTDIPASGQSVKLHVRVPRFTCQNAS